MHRILKDYGRKVAYGPLKFPIEKLLCIKENVEKKETVMLNMTKSLFMFNT